VEFLHTVVDFLLHLDVHLNELIAAYGLWTYGILFAIIFSETGLVVAPFLPGDSLLFAAGAISATGGLDPFWLFMALSAAAIAGNTTNYWIGYLVGPTLQQKRTIRWINMAYLEKARRFFEQYGAKTIVFARFLPIIRTFAPFVAGIASMKYGRFMTYNIAAGIAWVGLFVWGGYLFGNIPVIKNNFSLVIAAIIVVSTIPAVVEYLKHRRERKK
jgi:membrane-associated protein